MPKALSILKALLITAAILGIPYLGMPPLPTLEKQAKETLQHYNARYTLAQAETLLYSTKYTFQRWRGIAKLNSFIKKATPEWQAHALVMLFEYHRYRGVRPAEWQSRTWHEPLPRGDVEKAAAAALRLNKIAPERAANLLAEFIIYPVTVPAIPAEAIDVVRTQAESGNPLATKAMATYCTDDRFWHPCSAAEKTKWQNNTRRLNGTE